MKTKLLILSFLFCLGTLRSQDLNSNPIRYIELTGSAELEIAPDEIQFIIGIEEYWKEEFDKKTEIKNYKTKIPINEIENNLLDNLEKLGIHRDNIIVSELGNYWRYRGKEILISKQLELTLYDFNKIDEIISTINSKGINYMRIGELKNKDLTEYRKKVKIEALKAARIKAEYLLNSMDKQVGDIISITELNSENNYWSPESMSSNTVMDISDNSGIQNLRKIKLRYEIKVKYEIK